MANNIISTLLGSNPFVVYNQSTKVTVRLDVKVVRLSAKFTAEPQRQIMEDGTTRTDSKTVRPAKLTVDVICPDVNSLKQVNDILVDRGSLYQITSRGLIFGNFMVDSEFLNQTPEMLSATPIRMAFKQILIENVSPVIFANQADATIIERGIAAVTKVKDTAVELYGKAAAAVGNL